MLTVCLAVLQKILSVLVNKLVFEWYLKYYLNI